MAFPNISTAVFNLSNMSMTTPHYTISTTTSVSSLSTYTAEFVAEPFDSYHIGLIVFSVLVILSNIFAITMYGRHKKIRKNYSNVLLLSLAVSDLLIGLVYMPVLVACERTDFEKNKWIDTLSKYHHLLGNLCGFSTVFHIIALTVDKYVAVLYPFKKINFSSRCLYKKILIAIWTTASIFALIPLFWIFKDERTPSWYRKLHIYGIFQLCVFFGVSLLILIYCYARMLARIHRQKREAPSITGRVQRRQRTDRKTILVLLCFFAVFVIGWFPWFLFTLDNNKIRVPEEVKDFLVTLRFAGAFLNPLIYAFLKNDYRVAMKSDFKKCCSRSSTGVLDLLPLKHTNYTAGMVYRSHGSQDQGHGVNRRLYCHGDTVDTI